MDTFTARVVCCGKRGKLQNEKFSRVLLLRTSCWSCFIGSTLFSSAHTTRVPWRARDDTESQRGRGEHLKTLFCVSPFEFFQVFILLLCTLFAALYKVVKNQKNRRDDSSRVGGWTSKRVRWEEIINHSNEIAFKTQRKNNGET